MILSKDEHNDRHREGQTHKFKTIRSDPIRAINDTERQDSDSGQDSVHARVVGWKRMDRDGPAKTGIHKETTTTVIKLFCLS